MIGHRGRLHRKRPKRPGAGGWGRGVEELWMLSYGTEWEEEEIFGGLVLVAVPAGAEVGTGRE